MVRGRCSNQSIGNRDRDRIRLDRAVSELRFPHEGFLSSRFAIPVDNGATKSYWIYIQPLDGDVFGFPLRPGNISSYIYANTVYTDYPNEWYNGPDEGATDLVDDVSKATLVNVSAGDSITGINLITNKDDKSPYVLDVIPSAVPYNDSVSITSDIIVRFSEPVEINTFTEESCFITCDNGTYGGDYWYFYGSSGSCYKCYVDSYCLRMNNAHIWAQLQERYGDKVEMLEDQAWVKEDWDWIIK